MPPNPGLFTGKAAVAGLMAHAYDRTAFGTWKLLPTAANRMPAAASYLRRAGSDSFVPFKSELGQMQARDLGSRRHHDGIAAVFSSDLSRAATAEVHG